MPTATLTQPTTLPAATPSAVRDPARPHTRGILATALAARLFVLWFVCTHLPHAWLFSKGIELGTLADYLSRGRGLASPFGVWTGPTALLAPGYPAIVAAVFHLLGSFSFASAIVIMSMQLIFNLLTVLLIVRIANQCFGPLAADLAGLFWALSLPVIWMPAIFWETCLSTFVLAATVYLALNHRRESGLLFWASLGAGSAIAVLVNPALLLALMALLAYMAYRTPRRLLYRPALGLILFVLLFLPWPVRNYRVFHAFIPLRTTVGFELWVGNRQGSNGYLDISQFPIYNRGELEDYIAKGEVRYMDDKKKLADDYIRAHPYSFIRLSALRFLRYWSGTGTQDGPAIYALHASATALLGLTGVVLLFLRKRFRTALAFALPLFLFPLPYYITHAEFRYRLVLDPLLTILGSFTVVELLKRKTADSPSTLPAQNHDELHPLLSH